MYIYIILIIILFLLIIFHRNTLEKFDIFGAQPRGNGWGLGISSTVSSKENNCNPGFLCNTENTFGLYNSNCECISINKDNMSNSESCNPGFICMTKDGIGIYDNNCNCKITNNKNNAKNKLANLPTLEPDCYPRNTNFDALCKLNNPKNGIKNIIPCNNNTAKVECGLNYINGSYYDETVLKTPCQNIKSDFDTWCRYYNSNNIPLGYNINSIGSKELLIGSKGGCYLNDGQSDDTKASAICDYNHMEEIKKLSPANPFIDYNIFTDCRPIRGSNFIKDCANLLNVESSKAYADQIMGYDCNPGFARAKCVKYDDMKIFNKNIFNGSYDSNNQPVESVKGTQCNCA